MDSFFNSHPAREGDPGRHHNAPAKCDFNSHIPYSKLPIKFFNSRIPVRGATEKGHPPKLDVPNFNSRTRVECDYNNDAPYLLERRISTHAPAWGTTGYLVRSPRWRTIPTPAPHVGCDTTGSRISRASRYISTHAPLQGAGSTGSAETMPRRYFNSHTHAGCDQGYSCRKGIK